MVRTNWNQFSSPGGRYVLIHVVITKLTPTPLPFDVSEAMQVWNSKMGAASKEIELLESLIPHDRKEMALALFHENDYKINGKLFGYKY